MAFDHHHGNLDFAQATMASPSVLSGAASAN
jgi:hypothetical protein